MKRTIFILLIALGVSRASAQQVNISFDFDLYPEYYSHYDEDIYRYGFNINNYAVYYEDRFVDQVYREYGIRRSLIRSYLRRGFSPSDILFGAELSYRTRYRFEYVMNSYYRNPARDWGVVSVNLGIPFGSARFNLILNSFNRYYVDWGRYYHNHYPNSRPPMYQHSWSYFRPAPRPTYRPTPPNRPGQSGRPGEPAQPGRPGQPNPAAQSSRPSQPARPTQPNRPSQPAQPSQPSNNQGNSGNSETGYQRGTSTSTSATNNATETRREQATPPAATSRTNATNSSSGRSESTSNNRTNTSTTRSSSNSSTVSGSNRSSSTSRSSSGSSSRSSSSSSNNSSSRSNSSSSGSSATRR